MCKNLVSALHAKTGLVMEKRFPSTPRTEPMKVVRFFWSYHLSTEFVSIFTTAFAKFVAPHFQNNRYKS